VTDRAQRKYQVIADALRAEILAGQYSESGKLPSESELTKRFEVARGTVRDALQVLVAEDRIEARRGSGVYLRTFKRIRRDAAARLARSQWGAGRSIWDADSGSRPHREATQVDAEIDAPDEIAGVLGLPRGAQVCRRSRVHYSEGRSVQKSTSYFPADLVAGTQITQPDSGPGGVYARLDELGHGPARYREEVRARLPLSDEATALNITVSTPVILIVRTAFDDADRPVEVNEMVLDSNCYLLKYDFTS
jgi:GntR family transcriptional regulator